MPEQHRCAGGVWIGAAGETPELATIGKMNVSPNAVNVIPGVPPLMNLCWRRKELPETYTPELDSHYR